MRGVCPRCGREGYRVVKMVTGSSRFRLYACIYYKHKDKPRWCYIERAYDLDPPINAWDWSVKKARKVPNPLQVDR